VGHHLAGKKGQQQAQQAQPRQPPQLRAAPSQDSL
jgi:hypothetical protein